MDLPAVQEGGLARTVSFCNLHLLSRAATQGLRAEQTPGEGNLGEGGIDTSERAKQENSVNRTECLGAPCQGQAANPSNVFVSLRKAPGVRITLKNAWRQG